MLYKSIVDVVTIGYLPSIMLIFFNQMRQKPLKKRVFIFMTVFLGVFILAGCSSRTELKWNQDEGYRWADITPGFGGKTGFRKLKSSNTGITFENRMSNERIKKNQIFLNGSGVSTGDIDGDGLIDIYFARLEGPNKLYKNLGGFRFSDITEEAGVAHAGYNSTGVIFADVNGNGHLDQIGRAHV